MPLPPLVAALEEVRDLPNGAILYRRRNTAGGWTYYSDEVGTGVIVWDTALVEASTLQAALEAEEVRRDMERIDQERPSDGYERNPRHGDDNEILAWPARHKED